MKAVEFQSQLSTERTLAVPAAVAESVPVGQPVRVLLLIAEGDDEQAWEHMAALEFGAGYAAGDAIYDELSGR
jgi:hypothetical protein